jgi:methionine-S-sulfoxide reductase
MAQKVKTNKAYFAAGCFWGVEAILKDINGVVATEVGYMGGLIQNPTYNQVCTGKTGHAEAVEVEFDPKKTSYQTLLDYFWRLHDPTTPNQQGPNLGTQYRSAIFYLDEEQKQQAQASLSEEQTKYDRPIITEISPVSTFYVGEEYHQDYYQKNGGPVCHVLRPSRAES